MTIRIMFLALSLGLLAGCGASVRQTSQGFEEKTQIRLIGVGLVGSKIFLSGGFQKEVEATDLERFHNGVLGARNSELENQEVIVLNVSPGRHEVIVSQSGSADFRKKIFIVEGQRTNVRVTF